MNITGSNAATVRCLASPTSPEADIAALEVTHAPDATKNFDEELTTFAELRTTSGRSYRVFTIGRP
jgi:hypothetical protein